LRACKCDPQIVDEQIVAKYDVDEKQRAEIRDWYDNLLQMMRAENVTQSGHLQISKNVLIHLNDLHAQLLAHPDKCEDYVSEYYRTLPIIVQLRSTLPEEQRAGELETCFNALYGIMVMRLQGKTISQATQDAIAQISRFIALLAKYFHEDEQQPLFN